MTGRTLLFDGYGASIPAGGATLDNFDLREWPGCRMISASGEAANVCRILLLGTDPAIPPDMLAELVATAEAGEDVVLHARDDDTALAATKTALSLLGGGHA